VLGRCRVDTVTDPEVMSVTRPSAARAYLRVWSKQYHSVHILAQGVARMLLRVAEDDGGELPPDQVAARIAGSLRALGRISTVLGSAAVPPSCAALHADTLDALAAYARALDTLLSALRERGAVDVSGEAMALGEAMQRIGGLGDVAGRVMRETND